MGNVQRLLYRYIPSFKREEGGLYSLYAAVYSRIYAARMRYLHRRGRHGPSPHGRCQWCGHVAQRQRGEPT